MTWIVLTALLMLCSWAGIAMWLYGRKRPEADPNVYSTGQAPWKAIGLLTIFGSVGLWLVVSLFLSLHTVGQREVAIVYNFSGTISGKRDPGVVTVAPWQHVKKENVGILHDEWQFGIDNAAVSKDQQKILGLLAVNYQIEAANVVDLYKRVGAGWKSIIIDSRVPQVFKEVTATYATADITANREQLRIDTRNRLQEELAKYDIHVVDVFVKNLGFSESYTAAIEAKQKQVQAALQAEAKVRQARAEADQAVEAAKGEARSTLAKATADAQALRVKGRALKAYPQILQLSAIEKLNPQVKVIYVPQDSGFFLNTKEG